MSSEKNLVGARVLASIMWPSGILKPRCQLVQYIDCLCYEESAEQLIAEATLYENLESEYKQLIDEEAKNDVPVDWEKEEYYEKIEDERINKRISSYNKNLYSGYYKRWNPFIEDALDGEGNAGWNLG